MLDKQVLVYKICDIGLHYAVVTVLLTLYLKHKSLIQSSTVHHFFLTELDFHWTYRDHRLPNGHTAQYWAAICQLSLSRDIWRMEAISIFSLRSFCWCVRRAVFFLLITFLSARNTNCDTWQAALGVRLNFPTQLSIMDRVASGFSSMWWVLTAVCAVNVSIFLSKPQRPEKSQTTPQADTRT